MPPRRPILGLIFAIPAVVALVFWVRSVRAFDLWQVKTGQRSTVQVGSIHHRLVIVSGIAGDPQLDDAKASERDPASTWAALRMSQFPNELVTRRSGTMILVLPWWMLTMLAATPLALLPLARRRWERRLAGGRCPACGYDLRATPERCPECGTAFPCPSPST